jgi:hypothetical protein
VAASFASSNQSMDIEVELAQDDSDDGIGLIMSQEEVAAFNIEIKVLRKPPNQDINYVIKRDDHNISDLMVETQYKIHEIIGRVFSHFAYK